MTLHAASMAALFVDKVAQAPIVVQCAQSAPELLGRILLQVAQIVIPVAGGVLIAWMAFRWNSRKEREQWVRDQRRAEWRELLDKVSAVNISMTLDRPKGAVLKDRVTMGLVNLSQCLDDRMFIERQGLNEIYEQFANFLEMVGDYTADEGSCDAPLQENQGKEILKEIRDLTESVRRAASMDVAGITRVK